MVTGQFEASPPGVGGRHGLCYIPSCSANIGLEG